VFSTPMTTTSTTFIMEELGAIEPGWSVEIGRPDGEHWVTGEDLKDAHSGPFHDVLQRLGGTLGTEDRRTIAASFAMRFGWSAGTAIAAYVIHGWVPDIRLENISLRFGGSKTMFERLALHRAQGKLLNGPESKDSLLCVLRDTLFEQAAPVVEALRLWSHFPPRATWGMISSSWGAQCSNVFARVGDQCSGAELARALFRGSDIIAETQPHFYPVTYNTVTRMYYRSSSCCRYYLLPNGQYCAQCPLIDDDLRVRHNVEWLQKSLRSLNQSRELSPGLAQVSFTRTAGTSPAPSINKI
jgi:hypothetical protein